MRFAVLGPLSVLDGQSPLAVKGEKQRLLLAILLSRGGAAVSVDALVDALWDDQPPDFPHKRLSWHVHRLRGSLDSAERIHRDDNGYALRLTDCDVDAVEFERLCDEAATALRGGDPVTAARTWTAALRLWRGPAYGDLGEHRLLRADAARLAGRRLRTVADRIGVDLDLGRHEELVEELTALVAEHPTRERFRAQLMLALYRSGRRGEALDAYRDAHRQLVDQLGVEPGPQLRDLHRDILRDAARLAAPAPPSSGPAPGRPAELPAGSGAFTGRDPDLERLRALLSRDDPGTVVVSAVTGTGGVGKSALAIRAAHAIAHRYPDGQLYLNLRGATPGAARLEPAEALGRLLRSLDVDVPGTVTDADELAARFRSAVAHRRLLLLLDDAADAAQVTPLLPGAAACGVVVTSRDTLTQLDGAAFVRLDVLTLDDALRLFERLTGHGESDVTTELVESCGRMPLAICVAAARLNTDPGLSTKELAAQLRSRSRRLERLDDGQRAVGATFAVSYDNLDRETARLFRRLGLHRGEDFTVTVAAALAETTVEHATTLLSALVAAHLVERGGPDRYTMHDLVRLYAAERAAADETRAESDAAVERLLHAYLATARNALHAHDLEPELRSDVEPTRLRHQGAPIADLSTAYAWGRSELANLAAVTRQAVASGHPRVAVALAVATLPTLYAQGYWNHVHALCRIAAPAAESLDSRSHHAHMQRELATVELSLGLLDTGLEHATGYHRSCVALGDRAGEARALNLRATALRNLGRLDEATECLRRSLDVGAALPVGRQLILTWMKLGLTHTQAGRLDEAAESFRRAAHLAEGHGDERNRIAAISNLAYLLREAENPAEAADAFTEVLAVIRRTPLAGTLPEADALWGLGDSLNDLDRHTEAAEHWNAAAAILTEVGLIPETERRAIAASPRPEMPRVLR